MIPNKVFQCIAVGRPVLTAETPAIRGAFASNEIPGWPPGEPEALAEAIVSLLADGERREDIARAAHRRFLRDYCQESLAKLLERHLVELSAER